MVSHIDVDARSGKARCLHFVDRASGRWMEARGRVYILAASTLSSTRILLNSRSARHPGGIGDDSGVLGRYLADHGAVSVAGFVPALAGQPNAVQRNGANSICIPRFRNVTEEGGGFYRSFMVQGHVQRRDPWSGSSYDPPRFSLTAVLEMLPRAENRVRLDEQHRDPYGIPTLHIDCGYSDNEHAMARQAMQDIEEMAAEAGFIVDKRRPLLPPGSFVHEVGTARMGDDPKSSVVNPYGRCWAVPNLYVMDGAAFPSVGGPHPTLTMMALTVRACRQLIERSRALDSSQRSGSATGD
jgi:choline dehydrogenase-like flavoprotein